MEEMIQAMNARFDELTALMPNWDSYGGKPMTLEAESKGRGVLAYMFEGGLRKMPYIVPTHRGGVDFLWVLAKAEVELHVSPEGEVFMSFYGPFEENNTSALAQWISNRGEPDGTDPA